MKKLLIIGSKGMAGHIVYHYLKENSDYNIIDISRNNQFFKSSYNLDVSNFKELENILNVEKPDIVINCLGILNKDAEDHPDKAILLNSYFPHFLAMEGNKKHFKLIHISTDCVFNGKKGNYLENSPKDGIGYYAQSKAMGEIDYGNHLTIRTSIIGPELKQNGIGLFDWFMKQKGEIKGYTKAFWTGISTVELAKAILVAIEQNISGIHHLVNGRKINKFTLLNLFRNFFNTDIEISSYDDYEIDKSLIISKKEFRYVVPDYSVMIKEMKEWIIDHSDKYHYVISVENK